MNGSCTVRVSAGPLGQLRIRGMCHPHSTSGVGGGALHYSVHRCHDPAGLIVTVWKPA